MPDSPFYLSDRDVYTARKVGGPAPVQINSETKYVITVEGDYNDADYIEARTVITDSAYREICKVLAKIKPVSCNWDLQEGTDGPHPKEMHGLTDDEFRMVDRLMPLYDGEWPIHTLRSITVEPYVEPTVIWKAP